MDKEEKEVNSDSRRSFDELCFVGPMPCWQGASADTLPDYIGCDVESSTYFPSVGTDSRYYPSGSTDMAMTPRLTANCGTPRHTSTDVASTPRLTGSSSIARHTSASEVAGQSSASSSTRYRSERESGDGTLSLSRQVRAAVRDASKVEPWTGEQFKPVRILEQAERNQGTVHLMESLSTGCFAAVKKMPLTWTRSGPAEFALSYPASPEQPWIDIGIVKHLEKQDYPFACEFLGAFQDSQHSYFAFSYANGGDLFAWCNTLPPLGKDREAICKPVVRQLFVAVRWLHDLGIAHRDLSLENALVTDNGDGCLQLKLIDFSMAALSRRRKAKSIPETEAGGKPTYQAPETHLRGSVDEFLADDFSVGVMLLSMMTYELPWLSTRSGECEAFDYAASFGLKKFLSKRQAKDHPGLSQLDVLSGSFVKLIRGLLSMSTRHRLHLGEECYKSEAWRPSVWDMQWVA